MTRSVSQQEVSHHGELDESTSSFVSRVIHGPVLALCVLSFHAGWLVWSAGWQSPTLNEPGQLASGIVNWTYLDFEPAKVNPPLVRMIASIPAVFSPHDKTIEFGSDQVSEHEAQLGMNLATTMGSDFQDLVVHGRWMLIPFSLLGAWYCRKWALLLFGRTSGLIALWLWCFEPNIVGHAQLITNDVPAAAMGLVASYHFCQACVSPNWKASLIAGLTLGVALLTKFTWVILPPLWTLLLAFTCFSRPGRLRSRALSLCQHWCITMFVSLICLNAGFFFQGTGRPLSGYTFRSELLSGLHQWSAGTPLNHVCIPIPEDYLRGIDVQWRDLQSNHWQGYLGGEWKTGGWWYYYLYAAMFKLTMGAILLVAMAVPPVLWMLRRDKHARFRLVCLLVPAILVLVAASSQTALNQNFRYVIPGIVPWFALVGGCLLCENRIYRSIAFLCVAWLTVSSLSVAPYSLSYFNELGGGLKHGYRRLLHSNLDWGQDLVSLRAWLAKHPESSPVFLAYFGYIDPIDYGLDVQIAPEGPIKNHAPQSLEWQPGWYVVSKNYVYGNTWGIVPGSHLSQFQHLTPVESCGGSLLIYRVEKSDLNWFQAD